MTTTYRALLKQPDKHKVTKRLMVHKILAVAVPNDGISCTMEEQQRGER